MGLLTNWIALKCIFEPVEPVYMFGGKLKIQGLFLQRQVEVSGEFSDHLATKVLTSEKVWDNMLTNRKGPEFEAMLQDRKRPAAASLAAPLASLAAPVARALPRLPRRVGRRAAARGPRACAAACCRRSRSRPPPRTPLYHPPHPSNT